MDIRELVSFACCCSERSIDEDDTDWKTSMYLCKHSERECAAAFMDEWLPMAPQT